MSPFGCTEPAAESRSPRGLRAGVVAGALCVLAACSRPAPPPAVILISIDTLRADHLGLYGYERDTTPFLDRWSQHALVFDRAFTTAPWTLVAHMTMLTGLFPDQHGVTAENRALSPEIPLLAERLRSAGYRTVGLYYSGWIHPRHGFDRGFDVFQAHSSAFDADKHLRQVLGDLDGDKPLFLFLHLFDVHNGPFAPQGNRIYPSPPPYENFFVQEDSAPLPDLPASEIFKSRKLLLDPPALETLVAQYDGGIRQIDACLEKWFEELERRGILEHALVVVTSDHGEALGQRGRLLGHGEFWQEGLHVPLIVRPPGGLAAISRRPELVHLGDIVPTVLAACGLPADPRLPGSSLFGPLPAARAICGRRSPGPDTEPADTMAFALQWPFKALLDAGGSYRMVDLEGDPRELAPSPDGREQFAEWSTAAMGPGVSFPAALETAAPTDQERADLEDLGYGGASDKRQ